MGDPEGKKVRAASGQPVGDEKGGLQRNPHQDGRNADSTEHWAVCGEGSVAGEGGPGCASQSGVRPTLVRQSLALRAQHCCHRCPPRGLTAEPKPLHRE